MKIRTALLATLLVTNLSWAQDSRLQELTTIFIQGNGEAATHIRSVLIKRWGKSKTCLRLVGKVKSAEAVLAIAEQDREAEAGIFLRVQELTVVSGLLTLRDGTLVWSRSRRAPSAGPRHLAADRLLKDLEKACGCKRRRRHQDN
jgi:hypothetical protein